MNYIGIFGIGAIGSLMSKYIIQNKRNKCFYFNRSEKKSIRITFEEQECNITLELSDEIDEKLDWIIVCIKEYHIENAILQLKKIIDDGTKLVIVQNGINITLPYRQIVDSENILETIIDCSVERTSNDVLLQLRRPNFILPKSQLSSDFIQLFEEGAIEFETTTRFAEKQWIKLIESSALGSIQAYTGEPCSIFQNDKYLNNFIELVEEGIEVGQSEGIVFEGDLKNTLIDKLKAYPPSKGSSMLTDKLSGRQLELNAKIGAILKIAERNKIETTTTERIHNALVS